MAPETQSSDVFAVKTEVFEGPLELLIDLVERRKLLINDISLAAVTDEYLAHVSAMQERSLPGTAQFVALAATLLLIKSKSLLPVLELTDEEESNIEELEERLKLYQIYRSAAKVIEGEFGTAVLHEGQPRRLNDVVFLPDQHCTPTALTTAIDDVLHNLPKQVAPQTARVRTVISLEEMMDRLKNRIENQMRLRFSELVTAGEERTTVIVGFLAVLESVKQGQVLVAQVARFGDIDIEHRQTSTPRYQ
jgi:segregation and condensation protein A